MKHTWEIGHSYKLTNRWYFKCANCGQVVECPPKKKGRKNTWRPSEHQARLRSGQLRSK